MIITSLDNDNVKKWKKLCKKKYRDEFGIYLVEGEHLVEEAYKSGVLDKVIVLDGESYEIPATEFTLVNGYTNRYYVYFNKATASQMSMPVLATIVRGETEISNTVQYSIESYIHANRGADTNLSRLAEAMMKYADSAADYAGR